MKQLSYPFVAAVSVGVVLLSASVGMLIPNAAYAWANCCPTGFMTGGGSVFTSDGNRVTHGFELHCDATQLPNNLEINWGNGNKFHLETLDKAACFYDPSINPTPPPADFNTYEGQGTGDYNGVPGATAKWTFTDAGEPGTGDHAKIVITDAGGNVVLTVSGFLDKGNQQAHK